MSDKQDRTYARTAQDLERKYQFGKTFAEMLGLANDTRDKVDSVESTLRKEVDAATTLARTANEIVATAEATLRGEITGVDNSVAELSTKVEMKLDAEAVNIAIEKKMADGVDQVTTTEGYRFDDTGLHISRSDSEMSNKLDHTGMYVKRNGQEILTANSKGVEATNLHAKTYLIIGKGDGRSRFEDYLVNRTGCFWIGG
jgi:hypothetical protein